MVFREWFSTNKPATKLWLPKHKKLLGNTSVKPTHPALELWVSLTAPICRVSVQLQNNSKETSSTKSPSKIRTWYTFHFVLAEAQSFRPKLPSCKSALLQHFEPTKFLRNTAQLRLTLFTQSVKHPSVNLSHTEVSWQIQHRKNANEIATPEFHPVIPASVSPRCSSRVKKFRTLYRKLFHW